MDLMEIWKSELPPSEFFPISGNDAKFGMDVFNENLLNAAR